MILYCARFAAALCIGAQVATMNIGLEDTLAYYSPEEFAAGFKKIWHSSRASSSKIAALLERAFGLSSSKRSVLAGYQPV